MTQNNQIVIVILLILFIGCDDENNKPDIYYPMKISACGTTDPIKDIIWLQNIVGDDPFKLIDDLEIYKCIYDSIEGLLINTCYSCTDWSSMFYDCNGNRICFVGYVIGPNECPDFREKLTYEELIFSNVVD